MADCSDADLDGSRLRDQKLPIVNFTPLLVRVFAFGPMKMSSAAGTLTPAAIADSRESETNGLELSARPRRRPPAAR
jgi:hypothetical protein